MNGGRVQRVFLAARSTVYMTVFPFVDKSDLAASLSLRGRFPRYCLVFKVSCKRNVGWFWKYVSGGLRYKLRIDVAVGVPRNVTSKEVIEQQCLKRRLSRDIVT